MPVFDRRERSSASPASSGGQVQNHPAEYRQIIGSSNIQNYNDLYNRLVEARGGTPAWAQQKQQEEQPEWARNNGTRDMSEIEKVFSNISRMGEDISQVSGFKGFAEDQNPVETVGRFLVNLPTGLVAAPLTGTASVYAGLTHTPIEESDPNTGKIADYRLTDEQATAELVSGGIDTLGLLAGGSGQLGNSLMNIGRAGFGRATKAPLLASSRFLGEGKAAIVGDMAEEAAEEAIQSIADDVRWNQLDEGSAMRAFESAGWGAAGGGIMSGGGMAINKAIGADGPTASANIDALTPSQPRETEFGRNIDIERGHTYTQGSAGYLNEQMSMNNEIPGGINGVQVTSNNRLGFGDIELGQQILTNAVHSGVEGSLDRLADLFDSPDLGMTHDQVKSALVDAANKSSEAERLTAFQELIKQNGGIDVRVNRTPNSNPGEITTFRLYNLSTGSGISLHPLAWTQYGSDVDGDRMTIFLNNRQESMGRITRNLVNPDGSKINYSVDYAPFITLNEDKQQDAIKSFDTSIKNAFAPLPNSSFFSEAGFASSDAYADSIISKLKDTYKEARDNGWNKETLGLKLTNVLLDAKNIYEQARIYEGVGQKDAEDFSDNMVSNILTSAVYDVANSENQFADIAESAEQQEVAGVIDSMVDAGFEYRQRKDIEGAGSTGGRGLERALVAWGIRVAQTTTLDNPFFRQFPQIYAATQERSNLGYEAEGMFRNPSSAFDALFANLFRLVDVGFDVETAIESVYQIAVQDRFTKWIGTRRFGANDGSIDYDTAMEEFRKIRNDVAEKFNSSWKSESSRHGDARMPGAPSPKQMINENEHASLHKEFLDIFGAYDISTMFNVPDVYKGQRIADLVEDDSIHGEVYPRFPLGEANQLWSGMILAFDNRSFATAKRVESLMQGYSKDLSAWRGYDKSEFVFDEDGHIILTKTTQEKLRWMVQAFQEVFGYDVCYELGIHTVEGFLNSTWGRAMMSGDYKTALNGLISTRLTSLYSPIFAVLDDYYSKDETKSKNAALVIEATLADCVGISDLHNQLYLNWVQNKSLDMLINLTDLQKSYDSKVELYNLISPLDSKSNALLDYALRTSTSKLEMSKISQSLRKSQGAWRQATQQMGVSVMEDIAQVKNAIYRGTPLNNGTVVTADDFFNAVVEWANPDNVEWSSDTLGGMAYDACQVAKESVSKGTAKDSSTTIYLQDMVKVYGEQISSMDVMPISLGVLSQEQLLVNRTALTKLLTDKNAVVRVWTADENKIWYVTQKQIFESYGINISSEGANGYNIIDLLEKNPALATYVVPAAFNITYNGTTPGIQPAMAQSLPQAISEYRKMQSSDKAAIARRRLRNKVKSKVMGNPKVLAAALAHDPRFGHYISYYDATESINRSIEDIVDDILFRMSTIAGAGGTGRAEARIHGTIEDDQALIANVDHVIDQIVSLRAAQIDNVIDTAAYEEMQVSALDMMIENAAVTRLGMQRPSADITDEMDLVSARSLELRKALTQEIYMAQALLWEIADVDATFKYNQIINESSDLLNASISRFQNRYRGWEIEINGERRSIDSLEAEDLKGVVYDKALIEKAISDLVGNDEYGRFVISRGDVQGIVDGNADAIETFRRKARNIIEEKAEDTTWNEDNIDAVEKAIKKAVEEKDTADLERLRVWLDNISLISTMKSMNFSVGVDSNMFVAYQESQAREALADLAIETYDEFVYDEGNALPDLSDIKSKRKNGEAIKFHFEDPVHGFGFTDALFDLGGGGIPSTVSQNAGKTKFYAATGLLSNLDCGSEEGSEVTTLAEIRNNFINYEACHFMYRNRKGEMVDGGHFTSVDALNFLDIDTDAADTEFIVYRVEGCLCGGCARHGYKYNIGSKSTAFGGSIRSLVNHIMEAQALQLKKRVGGRDCLYRPMTEGIDVFQTYRVDPGADVRARLLEIRQLMKTQVSDNFFNLFNSDDFSKLNFGRGQADMFASFVTPCLRVNLNDGSTVAVPVLALANENAWNESAFSQLNAAAIKNVEVVVMSIDEACSHILRKVDTKYWDALANDEISRDDPISPQLRSWAEESWRDFSGLANPASVKELLDQLAFKPYANNMALFPNATATPMMKWFGVTLDKGFRGFAYENRDLSHQKPPTDNQASAIWSAYRSSKNNGDNLGNYIVVSATIDNNTMSDKSGADVVDNSNTFSMNHPFRGLTDSAFKNVTVRTMAYDSEKYIGSENPPVTAEFYYASKSGARAAFADAWKRNHAFIVKESYIDSIIPDDLADSHMLAMKRAARNSDITIAGEKYIVIDPIEYYTRIKSKRISAVSKWRPIDDPRARYKLLVCLDDPSIIGDSAIIWDPEDPDMRYYRAEHDFDTIDDYFSGKKGNFAIAEPFEIAENLSGIDDEKICWDIRDSYTGKRRDGSNKKTGKAEHVYTDAVGRYILAMKNKEKISSISNGDCIGFVRMRGELSGDKYAPIFYEGPGIPFNADAVEGLGIKGNNISGIIDASGIDLTKISLKWMFDGFAYKCVGKVVSKEVYDGLPKVSKRVNIDTLRDGLPHGYIDYNAAMSRFAGNEVRQLGSLLHNYLNVNDGGSILFDVDGKTGKIIPKANLNNNLTVRQLLDLQSGVSEAWEDFVNGRINIYDSEANEYNELVRRWANHLHLISGNNWKRVANFLCSKVVCVPGIMDAKGNFLSSLTEDAEELAATSAKTANADWKHSFVDATDKDLDMIFSGATKDDILGIYHLMTGEGAGAFCPKSVRSALSVEPGEGNDYLFNQNGEMLMDDGSRAKVVVEEPIADIHHSEYWSSQSYEGNLSHQAVSKRLMADGELMGDPDVSIGRLGTVVGDYEHMMQTRREKWISDILNGVVSKPEIDDEVLQEVQMRRNDPVILARTRQYRKECSDFRREYFDLLPIVEEYVTDGSAKDAFDNREWSNRMYRKLGDLNNALGYRPNSVDAITMEELKTFAKLQFGYSKNSGRGFNALTANQFEICVNRMISSVKETGFLINIGDHGYYTGASGDVRVPIGLLPRNLAIRVYNAPGVKKMMSSQGIHSFGEYVNKMAQDCKDVTMPYITTIENRAKRLALWKMVDAMGYTHGIDTISGHILGRTYMPEIMAAAREFGTTLSGYDSRLHDAYTEMSRLTSEYFAQIEKLVKNRTQYHVADENAWGGQRVFGKGVDESILDNIARNLVQLRRVMGMANVMMLPANLVERFVNQGMQSMAMKIGRSGIGPYSSDFDWENRDAIKQVCKSKDFIKIYSAFRTAELIGIDREFLTNIRSGKDIDAVIKEEFDKHGAFSKYTNMLMNFLSGGNMMIDGQIRNFIDRFAMEANKKAQWWMMKPEGSNVTLLEDAILTDPVHWFLDVMSGASEIASGPSGADAILARQCMNFAKRGDMAQRNLISAIYTEIAKRSSKVDFGMAAFVTPFFQFTTNRMGRILQWVAPISSLHYLATEAVTKGFASEWRVLGTGCKFNELALQDVQFQSDLREAITIDILHLGPQMVAFLLLGFLTFEPPEDDKKKGNFKEWTIGGIRVDANWWFEDILGLALPYACFGASIREGHPRFDLIVNGIAYYLSNNPVTKVADAVAPFFDPFGEFSRWYDEDTEGYAKAMGGPPTFADMVNGRFTSFGLSFVSQFLTPGFVREIYNSGRDYEVSYKRIYRENEYGELDKDAVANGDTQYTTYVDAMIRKYTRNNPVMGMLADIVLQPNTGYRYDEMPRTVIYDPAQMGSTRYFSIYNDPFNKKDEKSDVEKDAIAVEVIATLQNNDVSDLAQQGFALDYETKQYVSKYIWDIIAGLNREWNEFYSSDAANFLVAGDGNFDLGRQRVTELKQAYYDTIGMWKDLYREKLWSDEFSIAKYNRKYSRYMQDSDGNWYASGFNGQPFFMPVSLASSESEPDAAWKSNMGRAEDWTAQSIVTGESTGMRELVPITDEMSDIPSIESWSSDGTDTGYSDRKNAGSVASGATPSYTTNAGNNSSSSSSPSGTSYRRRSGGGGGGYSRGGRSRGGSGGGGYAPNIYSRVNPANVSNPSTMRGDRLSDTQYDYLRPGFDTKGSREAYKRSDI